jgi:hypothetical protein
LAIFNHPFLVARWAELTPLTRKSQQKFTPAVHTFDPGKTTSKIPAIQVPADDILYVRPPESQTGRISIVPNLFQLLEMRFNAPVVAAGARVARAVNVQVRKVGYWLSHKKWIRQ